MGDIFFNVCLGAVYSRPTLNEGHGDNNSLFVNVMFLILNCAVLVVAVGKSSDQNFFFDQYIVTALQKTLGVWSELFNYFFRKRALYTDKYISLLTPTCTILK
mgnify:CR=1 FL=1